jgi:excinuclease ABC subunit C
VHRTRGHDGTERLYLVRRGTVRAERPAPTSAEEERELAALVRRVYDAPEPSGADIPTHDLEEFYLVASWFRTHPPERVAVERPVGAAARSRARDRSHLGGLPPLRP